MSDHILIKEIRGFGYHGLFESERKEGQEFSVDLELELKSSAATLSDDIDDAVDYSKVIAMTHSIIIGEPVNLIERLAEIIAQAILKTFLVVSVEVTVHKRSAPVGVPIEDIAIRIRRSA
jgi:dihydroneopterin aldolase